MRKAALCLYGYFNNKVDPNAGVKGYEYIKTSILDKSDVDVFCHSWDVDNSSHIIELYNPVRYEIETQINFYEIALNAGISEKWINRGYRRAGGRYKNCTIQNSLSFYFSRWSSTWLKQLHEQSTGVLYDCVIVARYDLGQRSGVHRGYNVSEIDFSPDYDMEYLYSAMWRQLNAGYADQWFYSNSENIDKLSRMYSYAFDYLKMDSEYCKALTTGWFDSNADDPYSNEFLRDGVCDNLVIYPRWQMINNHLMHKWHIKEVGLYDKSRFL